VECPGIEQVPVFEKSAADKPEPWQSSSPANV
jgi:hypothetical protein